MPEFTFDGLMKESDRLWKELEKFLEERLSPEDLKEALKRIKDIEKLEADIEFYFT